MRRRVVTNPGPVASAPAAGVPDTSVVTPAASPVSNVTAPSPVSNLQQWQIPAASVQANDVHRLIPKNLEDLKSKLQKLGVPEELHPITFPRGGQSFTIAHKKHAASLQVLHYKRGFYLTRDKNGVQPPKPSITWATHDSVELAWIHAKVLLEWDTP